MYAFSTASFLTNPQYILRLGAQSSDDDDDEGNDKCTLVVSFMQKFARMKRTLRKVDSGTDVAIGFNLYKVRVNGPNIIIDSYVSVV